MVQARTDKSPEAGKVPLAAISFRTAGEAVIMFVDSVVGQVHEGCLQIAGLEVLHTHQVFALFHRNHGLILYWRHCNG